MVEGLATTLECTKFAIMLLDSKLDGLRSDSSDVKAKLDKLLVVLKCDEFGEWSSDIGHLVDALNLSLNALQRYCIHVTSPKAHSLTCGSRSLLEQQGILSSSEARDIIHTVEDRTSSLVWIEARKSKSSQHSSLSETSANLDLSFSFDAQLMSSKIYQIAQRSHLRQALTATKQLEAKANDKQFPPPTSELDRPAVVRMTSVAQRNCSAETILKLCLASATDIEGSQDTHPNLDTHQSRRETNPHCEASGHIGSPPSLKRIIVGHLPLSRVQGVTFTPPREQSFSGLYQDRLERELNNFDSRNPYMQNSTLSNGQSTELGLLPRRNIKHSKNASETSSSKSRRQISGPRVRRSKSLVSEHDSKASRSSNANPHDAQSDPSYIKDSVRLLSPHEAMSELVEGIRSIMSLQASEQIIEASKVGYFTPYDPTYKILSLALQEHRIQGDWREYALVLAYDNHERRMRLDERPLHIMKQLDATGTKSVFKIQRLAVPTDAENTLPRLPVFTFDLSTPSFPVLVKILRPIPSSNPW